MAEELRLFDPGPPEVQTEPPLNSDELLELADQMHDEGNYPAMQEFWRKAKRARHFENLGRVAIQHQHELVHPQIYADNKRRMKRV